MCVCELARAPASPSPRIKFIINWPSLEWDQPHQAKALENRLARARDWPSSTTLLALLGAGRFRKSAQLSFHQIGGERVSFRQSSERLKFDLLRVRVD